MSSIVISPLSDSDGSVRGVNFRRKRQDKRDHEGFTVIPTEAFIPYVWDANRHRSAVKTLILAGERKVCRCKACKSVRHP